MTKNKQAPDKEPLGLKPLDYAADITNIFEPIILDNPTEQEKWAEKKIKDALDDLPKPKIGYLMRNPK